MAISKRTHRTILIICIALAILAAAPLSAYTVVFRDGSSIVAMEPMTIHDDLVIVTLPSGTQTTYPLSEIDLDRTDELNRLGVRSGIVLNRPDIKVLTPVETDPEKPKSADAFKDFVRQNPGMDLMADRDSRGEERVRTAAGNLDLFRMERQVMGDLELRDFITQSLRRRDQRLFRLYAGTQPDSVLIDFTAGTEAEVFGALKASAETLLEALRERGAPQHFEIVMASSNRSRAGQFLLTASSARALLEDTSKTAAFFLKYVQF